MSRGRTSRGRARSGFTATAPRAKPLLKTLDEGDPVRITGSMIGAAGDRWIDPFLAANDAAIRRLSLSAEVRSAGGIHLELREGQHEHTHGEGLAGEFIVGHSARDLATQMLLHADPSCLTLKTFSTSVPESGTQ